VLRVREAQLHHATVAIEDAELELLVAHQGGTFGTPLDAHAGPAVKLIGDLIDERGRIGHGPIVANPAETAYARITSQSEKGLQIKPLSCLMALSGIGMSTGCLT
jgi:hypothetical protein